MSRTLLIVDTETSGLPRFDRPAEHPDQPSIASIAMIFATEDDTGGVTVEREYLALIKPDGWTMEAGAMAVNGLTMERLNAEGIPIAEAMAIYAQAIDDGRIVVAFNAQFDCKMARGALRRLNLDDRFERTPNICTMRAAGELMKLAPTDKMMAAGYKKFKPPKLAEAYRYLFGRDFADAHTALADARACMEIYIELRKRNALPEAEVRCAKEGTKSGEALAMRKATALRPPGKTMDDLPMPPEPSEDFA